MCLVREGDYVEAGQPLFELFADDDDHLTSGRESISHAVTLGEEPARGGRILLEKISAK
jgi:thymidine phosphorylase